MEADATDIRSLQCAARRLSVRACSTSDSAFPNSAERFLSTGCLSSPSGTACALALLLSSCYYNTSILQRQVLVLPHIHIQHSMEVNEDDFASVAPPITPIRRPTGAHQQSAAHRLKSQFVQLGASFSPHYTQNRAKWNALSCNCAQCGVQSKQNTMV